VSGGRALGVFRLGRVEYQDGLDLQASFSRELMSCYVV